MDYVDIVEIIINYLEDHLNEKIQIHEVARQGHISVAHLYRIYPVYTNYTVGQYIRARRLSQSAMDLLDTSKSITDIAFDYQFGTCENYIRAFRNAFGVTPNCYRKNRLPIALINKIRIREQVRLQKKGDAVMEPNMVKKQFLMVGLENVVSLADDFSQILTEMREQIISNIDKVNNKVEPVKMIGMWQPDTEDTNVDQEPKRIYFAGVEVSAADNIPSDFVVKELPQSNFAVFKEQSRGTMANYAYTQWLPTSGKKLSNFVHGDLEIFNDLTHFDVNDECEIYIAIE